MEELFSKHAPAYWERGISVIPLQLMSKRPISNGWTEYAHTLPSKFQQNAWLELYKANNMGLAAGPQSGLVFIDIDNIEPKVEAAILSVIPKSPWKRIGSKGCVYAYRFNGEPSKKIYQEEGNKTIVEILSTGNQVVMPPSIHPDTQMPYTANCELLDVYDILPKLPDDVYDRLRAALSVVIKLSNGTAGKFKVTENVSLGGRDIAMTRTAGWIAMGIMNGEMTVLDGMTKMHGWCDNVIQQLNGDSIDPNKGKGKILEFIKKDVSKGKMLPPGWDAELTPQQKIEWGLDFSDDDEEWSFKQMNDYIFREFEHTSSPTDPKRREVVNYILKKISKSVHLSSIDSDQIIKNLKDNSGLGLPVSAYNKELKALKAGPVLGENHTEIAEAVKEFFEERRGGQLVFHEGGFWEWAGSVWKPVQEQEIWSIISKQYGSLSAAKKSNDHQGIIKVLKNIIPQKVKTLHVDGVNFQNGLLTTELNLVEHQPEHGMTYELPFAYRPDIAGKCPKFLNYLHQSWGHHPDYVEKVQALKEMMAVTLFGKASDFQRCFLLYGPGRTGKSVLLDIIKNLVPEEAQCAVSPDLWGKDFSIVAFSGKLLNIAGELHERHNIDGANFKQVIDGSGIQVRGLYQSAFTLESRVAHWFASNFLPKTKDSSSGFNRRWLVLSFDKIIPENEIVVGLGELIASDEMEAIVAWAVEAMPELMARGHYTLPASHNDLINDMALANSPVRMWLNDNVADSEGEILRYKDIWSDFWGYCASRLSSRTLSPPEFKREFHQILQETNRLNLVATKDGESYKNLALKRKAK
jgi:P4 family phage/plasmid primase-like protien